MPKRKHKPLERALDFVIAEHEKNRLVLEGHERLIGSGIHIKDVYGALFGKVMALKCQIRRTV